MSTRTKLLTFALVAAVVTGALARLNVLRWDDPLEPHQADEHVLPLEALALWEGITPREVGWPASTTRLALSSIYAVQWLATGSGDAWKLRHRPDLALEAITHWIGEQYVDPAKLYRTGRALSVVTGIGQLLLLVWALRRWTGPIGVLTGTLACAIAPVVVESSQFVLADITGLFFVTALVGLAARPTQRGILAMALFAALATSSKFHYGLWLLAPVLCAWLRFDRPFGERLRLSLQVLGVYTIVVLLFVPWMWLSPVLMLKEFLGVVGSKVVAGAGSVSLFTNISRLFLPLGAVCWLGALIGVASVRRAAIRPVAPILIPTVIGVVALAASGTVFDRYALVFVPGLLLFASLGWDRWLSGPSAMARSSVLVILIASLGWTAVELRHSQRVAGEIDVDALARRWVLNNVPRGARVAVQDEVNVFLPVAADQLRSCVQYVETPAAYRAKWRVEGLSGPAEGTEPMKSVIMADERFAAYGCRRELQAQRDAGYYVVSYHPGDRFDATPERDVIADFRSSTTEQTGGVDVLVINRMVDVGRQPAAVLRTARGQRVIYLR